MADQLSKLVAQMQSEGVPEADILAFVDQFDQITPAVSHAPAQARPIATGGGRGTGLDVRKSDKWLSDNAPSIGGALATVATGGATLPIVGAIGASTLAATGGGALGSLMRGDDARTAASEGATQGLFELGGAGATRVLSGVGKRMYGGLLKAKDEVLEQFPNVVDDLLKNRRVIAKGSRQSAVSEMKSLFAQKRQILAAADSSGVTIPREKLRSSLDDELDLAISTSDSPAKDMDKLSKIERDFVPDETDLLPSRVDAIKSKLQGKSNRSLLQIKKGNRVSDTGARAKIALSKRAQQAVEDVAPDVAPLNAGYASEKGQARALKDALNRESSNGYVGMRELLAGLVGGTSFGTEGALAATAAMRMATHPYTGSAMAIGANELSKLPLAQVMRAHQAALQSQLKGPGHD